MRPPVAMMVFNGSSVILVQIYSTFDNCRFMPSSMRRTSKLFLIGPLTAALLAGCSLLPEKIDETKNWSAQQLYSEAKSAMNDGDVYKRQLWY